MRTKLDIEQYMDMMELTYQEIGDGLYHIDDDLEDINDIYVLCMDNVVTFLVRLFKLPKTNKEAFFETLLRLNDKFVAGAFSIDEEDNVILSDTLQLENLDFNEFQASVESIANALVYDYPSIVRFKG